MIYKNGKEYKEAVKSLNDALYEGAYKAKQESESRGPRTQPSKPSKSIDNEESE